MYWFKSSGVAATIHRWGLPGNAALSDLVTTGALLRDAYVLANGHVVVADLSNDLIREFNAAGSLVNSFAATSVSGDRLSRGATDSTVWLWNKIGIGNGQETFKEFTLATGATVGTPIAGFLYSGGASLSTNLTQPLTDSQAFGNSESCPFWILQTAFDSCTAPAVDTQPISVSISPAQVITLTVGASGTAPLSYQWYIGASGDTSSPIVGATSASYSTTEVVNTTSFWVRVSNECSLSDADSNAAVVTVTIPGMGDITVVADPFRWVRRSPTVFNDGKRNRVTRFQVDFQPGVGLSSLPTDESHDPIVRVRTSSDGGFTWSGFREVTLGAQGDYLKLMKMYQFAAAYNWVIEISGNTPTDLCIVQAFLDAEPFDH